MDDKLKIVPSFKDSLFKDNLKCVINDIVEANIDSVMQDGLFRDIPIVSTLVSLAKCGVNIRDRILLKQTLVFLNTFNSQAINKGKLNSYRNKINKDFKKAEAELGRIIILLNNNIDDIKSKLLAFYYTAYINEDINWGKFCELSDVVSRIFVSDLPLLLDVFNTKKRLMRTAPFTIDQSV